MSYDISLLDPVSGQVIQFDNPHQLRGGTYVMGGTPEAWLNITYNYAKYYYDLLGENGIRSIYGKTAAETLPTLKTAADRLGDDIHDNYWEATEGNAKRALLQLISLGEMSPDGIWEGD